MPFCFFMDGAPPLPPGGHRFLWADQRPLPPCSPRWVHTLTLDFVPAVCAQAPDPTNHTPWVPPSSPADMLFYVFLDRYFFGGCTWEKLSKTVYLSV